MSDSKPPDLITRVLSAIVMVAIAGGAFWAGGYILMAFVGLIALGLLWEFWGLVKQFSESVSARTLWLGFGIVYIGLATLILLVLSSPFLGSLPLLSVIGCVIATDVGAYFVGRTLGGPKIAPKISPSKTWSGLIGGAIASAIFFAWMTHAYRTPGDLTSTGIDFRAIGIGAVIAVIAQAGDFFQSWMKRKAGVKDSGKLIPGHGGLFDRTDGMIAVLFVAGLLMFAAPLLDMLR